MSFIGGWSDTAYYEAPNADLNDTTYTIGAIVGVGAADGAAAEAIFSSLGTDTGYELRLGGGQWDQQQSLNGFGAQTFAAQGGTTSLAQPEGPVAPVSAMRRVLFVALTVSAANDRQNLFINAALQASSFSNTNALAVGAVCIGNRVATGAPAENVLINSVFYADSELTQAELLGIYTQYGAYGRLPPNGVVGTASITHFWDIFDNKDAAQATWTSRGATGGVGMVKQGAAALAIGSTGTAMWGW
jgi:hypothetical protein